MKVVVENFEDFDVQGRGQRVVN